MNAKEAKANTIFHLKTKHAETVGIIDNLIHLATVEGKSSITLNKVHPDEAKDIITIYRMEEFTVQSEYWTERLNSGNITHVWLSINW